MMQSYQLGAEENSVYVAVLILGMVLVAIGGQGFIRLIVNSTDSGLLAWVPGGLVVQLVAYAALAAAGIGLAAWGRERARRAGQLS